MVLDIIIVALFVLMLLYGYKKGLIGIVAKLVSLVIAFALAYVLCGTVGQYISNTSLGVKIQTNISVTVIEVLNAPEETTVISEVKEKLQFANEQQLVEKLNAYVFTGIGFVTVFILSRIVLWIGKKILESIFELPLLKTFNKLGGAIASAILFVMEISIVLAIIKSLSTLAFMSGAIHIVETSVITKMLYEHNIFAALILSKIL